jgi:hypothetical protein
MPDPKDEWRFDRKTGRYRYAAGANKGKFAPRIAILELTRRNIEVQKKQFIALGDRLAAFKLKLADFQKQAGKILRRIHIQQAILGKGGVDKVTTADWKTVSSFLRQQFYSGVDSETGQRFGLKWLAEEVQQGLLSLAQLRLRLEMYAKSGKISFLAMDKQSLKEGGKTLAIRILGDASHCEDCIAYAALPPQPIDQITLPTQKCKCRINCECSILGLTMEEAIAMGLSV